MSLKEAIISPAESLKGKMGVSVKDLKTGEAANLNGDDLFPTASTFKVPVLVEFYRQVENGIISLDEKVILRQEDLVPGSGVLKELTPGMIISFRDLLKLMMVISDNTATDLVIREVGMENINNTLRELGLKKTKVKKYCREILFDLVGVNRPLKEMTLDLWDEVEAGTDYNGTWSLDVDDNDVTTPNEMTELLEMIATGRAASKESCDEILQIMEKCQTGQYRIPKYLPTKELVLQRKTGSLPGIRNDVGVIKAKEKDMSYVLSCYTMNAEDVFQAEESIARTSENIYQYFTG
ncbi:serine hydrolase [Candidatus Bathyarchaeota archaeon]|nr:serine hydrolase [Candidatus Bathyarchaeota archaeon]